MDDIAAKHRATVRLIEAEHHMARRMAGRGVDRKPVGDGVAVVEQHRLPRLDHRQHAIDEQAARGSVFIAGFLRTSQ